MRQSIGTTTTFQIILALTLIFSAFLALAITYNRVYKLKNETVSIIEKYEGTNDKALKIVNNYLVNSGYHETGRCEEGEYGMLSLDDTLYELAQNDKEYAYCLSYNCQNARCRVGNNNYIYYNIKLFFRFNVPFFGDLTNFSIKGQTKDIKLYSENQKLS